VEYREEQAPSEEEWQLVMEEVEKPFVLYFEE
jgi:hypothetical protein